MFKIIIIFLSFMISHKISYDEAKTVLLKIKNNVDYPDNEITSAVITIMEDALITAKISCDTLIKTYKKPTLLKNNVLAIFFEDDNVVSKLKSDKAFYIEQSSLKAMHNISIVNLDSGDSLYFVNPKKSSIVWDKNYGRISSDDEFVMLSSSGCTSGLAFESDVDLSNIKIFGIKGTNQKNPCNQ